MGQGWHDFAGVNAGYVLELYERYTNDPGSVDEATRRIFATWSSPLDEAGSMAQSTENGASAAPTALSARDLAAIVGAVNYAQAIRNYGHLNAQLDPLGSAPIGDPALDPAFHGIDADDLRKLPASLVGGSLAERYSSAYEATQALKVIYSKTTGYDFDHLRVPQEREWLREAVERGTYAERPDGRQLLERLTEVEVFENFLHRMFPGKHRFSIEGLDITVPMLDVMIDALADYGESNILIGMAHRGRLNVLAHTLGKPYRQILAEFKDPVRPNRVVDDLGWTGDVKYHTGGQRRLEAARTPVEITLAPNPSHLEFVNPVIEGMARAAGTDASKPGAPSFDPRITQPILLHGDAAFPGQGIVAETLNLSQLPGYWTGGTLHIIMNNQLGFTTEWRDARSTLYASDLAKGFKIPILHVNADDPEACIAAARLACAYVEKFGKDFVIDLIGYRRYGHNEGDEPNFTQPRMYSLVEKRPTVRALWAAELARREVIRAEDAAALVETKFQALQTIFESLDPLKDVPNYRPESPVPGTAARIDTQVDSALLGELGRALITFPDGFTVHPKLTRVIKRRRDALDDPLSRGVDWAMAEDLAMATILHDGIAVRLTGQDVERGTFSQRHAVFHDAVTGETHTPLESLPHAKAAYEVYNSPLSEAAALGFEYGYNVKAPQRLVLWEAQYGDFNNGAQVIIDEFITSARAKFGQTPSLVMLLPHGYEGAGPDHSSARLERFLQMAADTNMRVANATTAAQYFHLLRRQALLLESDPLPLVVMTPKSLLRSPHIASSLEEIALGAWQSVIDDADADPKAVKRLILCSGKVAIDLLTADKRSAAPEVAIVRVEQLYPFPEARLREVIARYKGVTEIVWLQEEPENMGAWEFARPLLTRLVGKKPLRYVGRPRSSSPSEGSLAQHQQNQAALIAQAFSFEVPEQFTGIVVK